MKTLFRTSCSTDWKGRPIHELTLLGTGTVAELLALQNKDVEEWQARDIKTDIEMQEPGDEAPTEWYRKGVRWEMDFSDSKGWDGLRSFASMSEGYHWSMVYHVLDVA